MGQLAPWVAFNVCVLALLAFDLGVLHRKAHEVSLREAVLWSSVWVLLSLLFGAGIYHFRGQQAGLEFFTGYLIEKALSVDNIFVFVLIFSYFSVPARYQHRILFWGVLGALVMRGIMIAGGTLLLQRVHEVIYVFGAFLLITGIRMAAGHEQHIDPESNPTLRLLRRIFPIARTYHGQRFIVREGARIVATPLLLVLAFVETTDLVFALDSIPAIFAITHDPFLVYTSNVCAVLGLRSLYFLLAGVVLRIRYLKAGLSVVLIFIGVKMLASGFYEIPITISLGVVAFLLVTSVVLSVIVDRRLARRRGALQATPAAATVPGGAGTDPSARAAAAAER